MKPSQDRLCGPVELTRTTWRPGYRLHWTRGPDMMAPETSSPRQSWLPGTEIRRPSSASGANVFSKRSISRRRPRCVRSPVATTYSTSDSTSAAHRRAASASFWALRPMCRSEMCANRPVLFMRPHRIGRPCPAACKRVAAPQHCGHDLEFAGYSGPPRRRRTEAQPGRSPREIAKAPVTRRSRSRNCSERQLFPASVTWMSQSRHPFVNGECFHASVTTPEGAMTFARQKRRSHARITLPQTRPPRLMLARAPLWHRAAEWLLHALAVSAVVAIVLILVFIAKEALPILYSKVVREEVTLAKMWWPQLWPGYDDAASVWQPVSEIPKFGLWPLI